MTDERTHTPLDDAEKVCHIVGTALIISNPHVQQVRLKRLAKLAGPTPSPSPGPSTSKPATPPPAPKPEPKSIPRPTVVTKPVATPPTSTPITARKPPQGPTKIDLPSWEHATIEYALRVTFDVRDAIIHRIYQSLIPLSSVNMRSNVGGNLSG